MAGIYIYSDKKDNAAELIGFAKEAGKEANVINFSPEAADAVKGLGADNIYLLKGDSTLAENYGKAIADFLRNEEAELFVVGATPRGRDIGARVAGYLDCAMVSDASFLSCASEKIVCERMMYGGAVVQSETLTGLSVVTVPAGKFEAATGGTAEVVVVAVDSDSRVSLLETASIVKEGADLASAEKVIGIGLGMEKKEDMHIAEELAAVLGAELACTRSVAEEKQWLPIEQYIGISGAVIKPQLYLSMGISGQIQHVVGVRDSKVIVAVDTNEKAPIFKSADYGIVGDMYEIIPMLTEALKNG